jgi:hypothetical protein
VARDRDGKIQWQGKVSMDRSDRTAHVHLDNTQFNKGQRVQVDPSSGFASAQVNGNVDEDAAFETFFEGTTR